ncbi:hypothetical protein ES702_02577 [subsurface metagenome]
METKIEPDELLQIAALLNAVERDPDLDFNDIECIIIGDNAVSIYFKDNQTLKDQNHV